MAKRFRALVQIAIGDGIIAVGEEVELADRDAEEFLAAGFVESLPKVEEVDPEPAAAAKPKRQAKRQAKPKRQAKRQAKPKAPKE